jgi:hypothetical protein
MGEECDKTDKRGMGVVKGVGKGDKKVEKKLGR